MSKHGRRADKNNRPNKQLDRGKASRNDKRTKIRKEPREATLPTLRSNRSSKKRKNAQQTIHKKILLQEMRKVVQRPNRHNIRKKANKHKRHNTHSIPPPKARNEHKRNKQRTKNKQENSPKNSKRNNEASKAIQKPTRRIPTSRSR